MSNQLARSYWNATASPSAFPNLSGALEVDVAIVGGGIVGITTARMLKEKGVTVAVVEARKVGRQVTGKSTAKVTTTRVQNHRRNAVNTLVVHWVRIVLPNDWTTVRQYSAGVST